VLNIRRHGFFVRMFSSAILMQALLSGANLCVGMLLIRHTSNAQYGYYVLVSITVILLTAVQTAYIQPSLVIRLTRSKDDPQDRANFVGSLYRDQRNALPILAAIGVGIAAICWVFNLVGTAELWVISIGAIAITASLFKEFFRMVLLAYRRPNDVVRGDAIFVVVLVSGAAIAIFTPIPAVITVSGVALAAIVGGEYQRRSLQKLEPWNPRSHSGALKEIYSAGIWAVAGSAVHWAFTQGYNYIVAGVLTVDDVAAINATRILMMPVNLISTGLATFMFPTVAGWLSHHRIGMVLRRIFLFAAGLVLLAMVYLVALWITRGWIFEVILRKHFEHRDGLLVLWSAICILMVLRDHLAYTLVAHARFRLLAGLAAISAAIALVTSYFAMRIYGQPGALMGILIGEALNVVGIVALSIFDARQGHSELLRSAVATTSPEQV
jgi:O-antigen/teichoic acid export membrane protein